MPTILRKRSSYGGKDGWGSGWVGVGHEIKGNITDGYGWLLGRGIFWPCRRAHVQKTNPFFHCM